MRSWFLHCMLEFSFFSFKPLSLLDARPTLACVHDVCELGVVLCFHNPPSKLRLKLALSVTIKVTAQIGSVM